jgi:carbon-monoxide dehydrogenase medium subunit
LRASVVIQGSGGSRTVAARDFHVGPYETVVRDAEMIIEFRVPIRPGGGSAYRKVERRAGDWAVAAAGAAVWLQGDTITEVGIGLTAVGAEQFCAPAAEDALRGRAVSDEAIDAAGALAAEHCSPATDQRGPAEYKRHLAGELTKRALRTAIGRAKGVAA